MSTEEVLALLGHLQARGIRLRRRGAWLWAEGGDGLDECVKNLIARNWHLVAAAVAAQRQADRVIASASRGRCARRQAA